MKRFDKKGKGRLTVDDYYNVIKVCLKQNNIFFHILFFWLHHNDTVNICTSIIKVQNKVDTSKDEIRKLVADLEMDKEYRVSIKVIYIEWIACL